MKVKTLDAEAEECNLMRKNESIHVNEHLLEAVDCSEEKMDSTDSNHRNSLI